MPSVDLNDPRYNLESIKDPVEKFNMFIRKWCPDAAHLLDSDQNDGQAVRDMLESMQDAEKRAELRGQLRGEKFAYDDVAQRINQYDYSGTDPRESLTAVRHHVEERADYLHRAQLHNLNTKEGKA